jgi:hypothetical protein
MCSQEEVKEKRTGAPMSSMRRAPLSLGVPCPACPGQVGTGRAYARAAGAQAPLPRERGRSGVMGSGVAARRGTPALPRGVPGGAGVDSGGVPLHGPPFPWFNGQSS